jgi:bifunctional non-homologous end joining protein LigD
VSTPVTWKEIDKGCRIEDFRLDNVRARIAKVGDLWKPLLQSRGRFDLSKYVGTVKPPGRRRSA